MAPPFLRVLSLLVFSASAQNVDLGYDKELWEEALQLREQNVSAVAALSSCARNSFPDLLPYKSARIDVFLRRSLPGLLDKEFLMLSIDGKMRGAGLISSGKSGNTQAGRYYIFGLNRNHQQTLANSRKGSYMPYDFMLAKIKPKYWGETHRKSLRLPPVEAWYSQINFHGTDNYGVGSFGSPASHGCIRMYTSHNGVNELEEDFEGNVLNSKDPLHLKRYGLHRINWKYLNPFDWSMVDLIPNRHASKLGSKREKLKSPIKKWNGDWFYDNLDANKNYHLKKGGSLGVEEMSRKVRIEFHDVNSLKNIRKKELLEDLYREPIKPLLKALKEKRADYVDYGVFENKNGLILEEQFLFYPLNQELLNELEQL
jgi:hypothetical protein